MTTVELEELGRRKRAQVVKLIEVADVTRQIAEAVEHRDEVSAQMLLSEREKPVRELREIEDGVRNYVKALPQEDAMRAEELLKGADAATEEESILADQAAQFRRIYDSVRALDEQVSVRLGGNKSFYKMYRT